MLCRSQFLRYRRAGERTILSPAGAIPGIGIAAPAAKSEAGLQNVETARRQANRRTVGTRETRAQQR
jgi:hypothetical protein